MNADKTCCNQRAGDTSLVVRTWDRNTTHNQTFLITLDLLLTCWWVRFQVNSLTEILYFEKLWLILRTIKFTAIWQYLFNFHSCSFVLTPLNHWCFATDDRECIEAYALSCLSRRNMKSE